MAENISQKDEGAEKFMFPKPESSLAVPEDGTAKVDRKSEGERREEIRASEALQLEAARRAIEEMGEVDESGVEDGEALDRGKEVKEIFERNRLLARAMSPVSARRQRDRSMEIDYSVWDEELDFMESSEGMPDTSCTLLVPGKKVRTYKPYGFLMNADKSQIQHVADSDSGSSGTGDRFRANPTNLVNLDQLAQVVSAQKSPKMNEANARFTEESICGLFVDSGSRSQPRLETIMAQRHLREKGVEVSIFEYNEELGEVELWEPHEEEIRALLEGVARPDLRAAYELELGSSLD